MDKKAIIGDIEHLRSIAVKSKLAYALRIKIFRQTVKLLQNISQFLSLSKPDRLEEIKEEHIHSDIKDICLCYNSIVKVALSLSQPSESLDEKWSSKWNHFLDELEKLEQSLENKKIHNIE